MLKNVEQSQFENEDDLYVETHQLGDGKINGIRWANPTISDARAIGEIIKDIYGWNYLYPNVYDEVQLSKDLLRDDIKWIIIEDINSKEINTTALFDFKTKFRMLIGKLCVKSEYQGRGIVSYFGNYMFRYILTLPRCRDMGRIDCDIRATEISSQKFTEGATTKAYGFLLNYNNYMDKRFQNISSEEPIVDGELGAVILYSHFLGPLWKIRNNEVYLIDDDNIYYYYNLVKSFIRKLKRDKIVINSPKQMDIESYTISKDYYKGTIKIEGYLKRKTLKDLIKELSNWNLIEWRVPATEEGLFSQKLAINNDFIVSGYDPGSVFYDKLYDTIIFCLYPRGIDYKQIEDFNLTPKNQMFADNIIANLREKKVKQIKIKKKR